ncbi:5'-3' exonuclease [[Mycoplasma] gypis]|uniref:5'-3' exonuclease n=1 Tax=[Mycoplasma] gypis TaxID=92404 RepID=A0ABZ2RNB5_9BACT|nr:5'-3' exonuclease H3TH domain-containing protein [[Mycoplasma] gypis]MBN0919635.1 hypothetical protein [[Mycoplasma] gypis]
MNNQKILIIDGTYLVFKSYYGTLYSNQKLETSTGMKTNAIVGFFNTFFKLLRNYSPDSVYFCFDANAKTFRHDMYQDYKAQRAKAPEDFYIQLVQIKDLLQLLNIPMLEKPGYEADDIVATLTKKFQDDNYVLLFSADQDLNQLINNRVAILKPKNKNLFVLNQNNFYEVYGFHPHNVVDIKALMGDASDNFKGIKGVGPKTAIKLIEEFGSLESIFNNFEKLDKKYQQKFLEYKEEVLRNKYLAQLRYDVPLNQEDYLNKKLNIIIGSKAEKMLEELELKQIKSKLKEFEAN